jgi:NAD(P)H-dependent FMN reductase
MQQCSRQHCVVAYAEANLVLLASPKAAAYHSAAAAAAAALLSWHAQIGDHYDTLLFPFYTPPPDTAPGALLLRFQPGKFSGFTVMHCQ